MVTGTVSSDAVSVCRGVWVGDCGVVLVSAWLPCRYVLRVDWLLGIKIGLRMVVRCVRVLCIRCLGLYFKGLCCIWPMIM